MPRCLRRFTWPIRFFRDFFKTIRINLWILEEKDPVRNLNFKILYAGHELNKNFWNNLIFGDSFCNRYIGKKWLWRIPSIVKNENHACSLSVIEVPHIVHKFAHQCKSLQLPWWVDGEADVVRDYTSLFKQRNTSLKSDLSKIRKNKLCFEITHEVCMLKDFYYNMYAPYIKRVHGDRSIILSYDYVKSEFHRRGRFNELLLVKKRQEHIAGILLGYKKNKLTLWALGIRNGDSKHVEEGVTGALYYFSVRNAVDRGVTKVSFGESRPFLKNGILRFKKKWNQRLFKKRMPGFLISVLSETARTKEFLCENPFIFEDKEGLKGAVFVSSEQSLSSDDFANIYRDYYLNGLSKLVVYRFGEDNGLQYEIPPELSEKIEVCSAMSVF